MEEDKLFQKAMDETKELAANVIDECIEFANDNDYETEWVLERFQEQFLKVKAEFLKKIRE